MPRQTISRIVYGDYLALATSLTLRSKGRNVRRHFIPNLGRLREDRGPTRVEIEGQRFLDQIVDRYVTTMKIPVFVIDRIPDDSTGEYPYELYSQEGFTFELLERVTCQIYKETQYVKDSPSTIYVARIFIIFEINDDRPFENDEVEYIANLYSSLYGNYKAVDASTEATILAYTKNRNIPIKPLTVRESAAMNFVRHPYAITPKIDGVSGTLYLIQGTGRVNVYLHFRDSPYLVLVSAYPGRRIPFDIALLVEIFDNQLTQEKEYFIVDQLYTTLIEDANLVTRRRNIKVILDSLTRESGQVDRVNSFTRYTINPFGGEDLANHHLTIKLWTHPMKVIKKSKTDIGSNKDPYEHFVQFWLDFGERPPEVPLDRGLSVVLYPINEVVSNLGKLGAEVYKLKSNLDNTHDSIVSDQAPDFTIYNKGNDDQFIPFRGKPIYPCNPQIYGVTSNIRNVVCEVSIMRPEDNANREDLMTRSTVENLNFYRTYDERDRLAREVTRRESGVVPVVATFLKVRTKPIPNNISTAQSNYTLYIEGVTMVRVLGNSIIRVKGVIEDYVHDQLEFILKKTQQLRTIYIIYPIGSLEYLIGILGLQTHANIKVIFTNDLDAGHFSALLAKIAPFNVAQWSVLVMPFMALQDELIRNRDSEVNENAVHVDTLFIFLYTSMSMSNVEWKMLPTLIRPTNIRKPYPAVYSLDYMNATSNTRIEYDSLGVKFTSRMKKQIVTTTLQIDEREYERIGNTMGIFSFDENVMAEATRLFNAAKQPDRKDDQYAVNIFDALQKDDIHERLTLSESALLYYMISTVLIPK